MLYKIHSDDNQLAGKTQLCHNNNFSACKSLAFDKIFLLARITVFLPLHNLTSEDAAFNVENRQAVVVHFFFGMQYHHILAGANFLLHSLQDAVKHDILRVRFILPFMAADQRYHDNVA